MFIPNEISISKENRQILIDAEKQLRLISDLTSLDVFIDIFTDEDVAVVAAHAMPQVYKSAYSDMITGQLVSRENEPAVFHSRDTKAPVSDMKAVSQENITVLQNVAPILGTEGNVLAVIVQERDVSDTLRREKKLEELSKITPFSNIDKTDKNALAIREMNHRVKNNLQMISSILNLQAMQTDDEKIRDVLKENIERVLSIAAVHDIICYSKDDKNVNISELITNLIKNLGALVPAEKCIVIDSYCDDFSVSQDTASSLALVITELIMNSIRHGFCESDSGKITVSVYEGVAFGTVVVLDNGCGFDVASVNRDRLGLNIVSATVHDKLEGQMTIESENGTRVCFSFKMNK